MARGIDRQAIFHDDQDREDFLRRLAELVSERQLKIFAWALMPNHFHLLVETGERPLERSMRSLLAGYATVFNRRHGRVGHLFQNRYKSIVCEADQYFLELVRYIHLNPLRAGIVRDFDALDDYPYTGHSALLATLPRPWQDTRAVLERFAKSPAWARATYRKFASEGVPLGRRPELVGGGLVRSSVAWNAVDQLAHGREDFTSDERVLGSGRFVEQILREIDVKRSSSTVSAAPDLRSLKEMVCAAGGVSPASLSGNGQPRVVSKAREGLAYLWVEFFGQSGLTLALDLGLRRESIYKAAKRGRRERERWIRVVDDRMLGEAGKHSD